MKMIFPRNRICVKFFIRYGTLLFVALFIIHYFGIVTHFMEHNFAKDFKYPYDDGKSVSIGSLVYQMRHGQKPEVDPINNQTYSYRHNNPKKCMDEFGQNFLNPHLIIIVKSAMSHFDRRNAIRNSWGFERRFSDVLVKTVFTLGIDQDTHDGKLTELQKLIELESHKYNDIIQFNFIDSYFNNTIKTVNGLRWCKETCIRSKYYLFVDDDFYVSVKNVLSFLKNPINYPEYLEEYKEQLRKINQRKLQSNRSLLNDTLIDNGLSISSRNLLNLNMELPVDAKLFSGFVFNSSPHRHRSSKWYVSLDEYKWDMWPTYVTAGVFILSREALIEMYYVSLFTKHFR